MFSNLGQRGRRRGGRRGGGGVIIRDIVSPVYYEPTPVVIGDVLYWRGNTYRVTNMPGPGDKTVGTISLLGQKLFIVT